MLSYRALELGVDTTFLGVVAAAFAIAPLLLALRIGRLVDRGQERPFALAGMLAVGVAALLIAAQASLPVLLLGSMLMGLGHLSAVVATQALVASGSAADRYDRRYAHVAFVASFGQLVGPALGGIIAAEGTPEGTTAALVAGGLLGLTAVPFTLAMRAERAGGEPRHATSEPVPLTRILRSPGMPATMLASLTVLAGVDILQVYLPALGEEVGWSPLTVGSLLAVRAGASMVSRLGLGVMADRFGRGNLLIGCLALSAVALAALPLATGGLVGAFAIVAVAGFALGLGQPLTVSSVAARAEPGTRATALSVRMMGNRLGQVAVPITAGLIAGVAGVAGVLVLTGAAFGATTAIVAGDGRSGRRAAKAR